MSTEQSLDPQLIEQTKQQIRTLVNEIAQLTKSELSPEEFHSEFLPRVVSALAAIGGAVWTVGDEGRLGLAYQINIQETKLRDRPEDQVRHGRLVQKCFTGGEPILVPPHSGAGDDEEAANPTDFLLVLGPIKTDEVVGVVEVFQRPESRPATQKGYLRFLVQMCELAGDYFKSRQLRHFSDRQVLWTQLEEFARQVHSSLDPRETAYTIANEGRRLIECDRVSVAIRRGRRCFVEAVSGQDMFDKRSNTIRLLGNLASAVVAGGEPVWYTGDTSKMAPQIEDAIQEYIDESHTKALAVLPLGRIAQEEVDEIRDREDVDGPVGALIVEQIEDARVPAKMRQRVEVVAAHTSTALANALEHHNLFLMPVWKTLGKTRLVLKARTLPKAIAIASAVLAAILFLCLWPADFEIEAKGTLEPVQRRDVFAAVDGVVQDIAVQHAQMVEPEQVLARLRNVDLDVAIKQKFGERDVVQQQIMSVARATAAANRRNDRDEEAEGYLRKMEYEKKLDSISAQLELLAEKKRLLEVKSPVRGQITTWDVYNRLIHRPVQRGQLLMSIADPDGPWQLEVQVPENHQGHVDEAVRDLAEHKGALPVEYILKNDPSTKRKGKIKEIHRAAEVHAEEGNTVLVKVDIDKDQLRRELPELRPGAATTAKIYCGRRPIGYVWLHDAIAFFQSRVLFRFF